jgi:hypothetical protein
MLVPHPRFGTAILPAGSDVTEEEIRRSSWQYRDATIFPETAIRADLGKQNFCCFGRPYYVDILRHCRVCRRPFIFFAREQQHWFETLGFWIDADCLDCPECRYADQKLRQVFDRFSKTIQQPDLTDEELTTLVEDAVVIWKAGILRSEQKLRRLRNLAHARIRGSPAVDQMDELVASITAAAQFHDGPEI